VNGNLRLAHMDTRETASTHGRLLSSFPVVGGQRPITDSYDCAQKRVRVGRRPKEANLSLKRVGTLVIDKRSPKVLGWRGTCARGPDV